MPQIEQTYYDAFEKLKRPHLKPIFNALLDKIDQGYTSVQKPIRSCNMVEKSKYQLYEAVSNMDGGYRIYWKKLPNVKDAKPIVIWCGLKKNQMKDVKTAFQLCGVNKI